MSKTNLIFDTNNLVYRTFYGNVKGDSIDVDFPDCIKSAVMTINKYYKKYQPDDIILVFDSPFRSWRKIYTASSDCISHKKYKGHRRKDMTEAKAIQLKMLDKHIGEFKEFMKNETSLLVLEGKYLEADDIIAMYTKKFKDDKNIIISSDKDFIQLLGQNNLTLIDPTSDKPRSLSDYDNDPGYFMFNKCLRGDKGDNVQSSYPRIRATKIKEAYYDEFKRTNVMNNKFKVDYFDDTGVLQNREYTTVELFEENEILMDLSKQPEYINNLTHKVIDEGMLSRSKFNYFKFLKFCGRNNFDELVEGISNYTPMLSIGANTKNKEMA